MTIPSVALPRIVGGPSVVNAALLPHRQESAVALSFQGVVTITEAAIREIVLTGTVTGTRPIYLLDTNPAIETAVGEYLHAEPIFAPFVRIGLPPEPEPEPASDPEPVFVLSGTRYTFEEAVALRDRVNTWIASVVPAEPGTGQPT